MQHPKYHLESLPCHYRREERNLASPRSAPVVLDVGEIDQPHVQDNSQETLHLRWSDWLPLVEDGPWTEAVTGSQGLY